MKVHILGHNPNKPHIKKVRASMGSSAHLIADELDREFDFTFSVGDNMFGQIANIEIDFWLDTETGNVDVDGAWN